MAAAQNCVMLGLFSYAVDYMQLQGAEAASRRQLCQVRCRVRGLTFSCRSGSWLQGLSPWLGEQAAAGRSRQSGAGDGRELNVVSLLLSPALPWTRPACSGAACALQLPYSLGMFATKSHPEH